MSPAHRYRRGPLSATINADLAFLDKAVGLAEHIALMSEMEGRDRHCLELATEEVFAYLSTMVAHRRPITITGKHSPYCATVEFLFKAVDLKLKALNLTYRPAHTEDDDLQDIGLLIASRSVDRFSLSREDDNRIRLSLIKEKTFAAATLPIRHPAPAATGQLYLDRPRAGEVRRFADLLLQFNAGRELPLFCHEPDRLAAMVKGGGLEIILALDQERRIGGGILWRRQTPWLAECYGPYLFKQPSNSPAAALLVESCMEAMVDGQIIGLINRHATGSLPPGYFEELGSYSIIDQDGSSSRHTTYYRQIKEDPGINVTAHPLLEDFLTQEYRRLVLQREVDFVSRGDAREGMHSVLAVEFNRLQHSAALRPIWFGRDMEANLHEHLLLLERESWKNISCLIDVGVDWHGAFVPPLMEHGFMPRLLLPLAGKGDLVIFRRPASLHALIPKHIKRFEPYIPSKPGSELKKQYGYQDLHRLNNNENALGPPLACQRCIHEFPPLEAAAYPSGDSFHLRRGLADAFGLHPDQIIVGNGANEIITLLIKSFCHPGDNIVTADKTYGGYEWVARFSGIDVILTPLKELGFDDQGMLAAANQHTRVIFICNPNNPTGQYWSRQRLVEFLDDVRGRWIVVLDEAYCEFVARADFPNGLDLIHAYPNLVVFRTFSKMYGLAGLRIGYLAGDMDTVNIIRRTAVVYSVNAIAQAAALAAIKDKDHIERTRAMVAAGKDYLHAQLSRMGLEHVIGEGNYVPIRMPVNDNLVYRKLLARGLLIRTMTPFRFPNSIRVTVAQLDVMRAFIEALGDVLEESRAAASRLHA